MKRLKEQILEDNHLPTPSTSSSTGGPTLSTSSSTGDPTPSISTHTTRSNDTYIYGVDMLTVLAIGACVFFTYNTFQSKKFINDCLAAQYEQKHLPKRRHAVEKYIQ